MDILISVVLPLSLAFIMFSLGLGLTFADFGRVLEKPLSFGVGAVNQVLLIPVMALIVIMIFGITKELAVGFMILSFCPGGVTSNILTRLAKGDVALSVTLTAVISLSSILVLPFFLALAVSHFMGADAEPVNVTDIAIKMFLISTLPVLLGLMFRRLLKGAADRSEAILSKIATVLFVVIVIAAVATNWDTFIENLTTLAPALVTLNVALLAVGCLTAKAAGLSANEMKTIAIETGIQNSTLGITVATLIAGAAAGFTAYSLPAAVYGITMYFVFLPLLAWFRKI